MKTDVEQFLKSFQGGQVADIGEGMKLVRELICNRWRNRYLVNTEAEEVYELVGADLTLKCVSGDDIDWDRLLKCGLHNREEVLSAVHSFTVYAYNGGIAYACWTLHPDRQEGADGELHTAGEVGEEIGAYIDKKGRILVKFQLVENERTRQQLRHKALRF